MGTEIEKKLYQAGLYPQKSCDSVIPVLEDVLETIRSEHLPKTCDKTPETIRPGFLSNFHPTYFSKSGQIVGYTRRDNSSDFTFTFHLATEYCIATASGDTNTPACIHIASPKAILVMKLSAPAHELRDVFKLLAAKTIYIHDLKKNFREAISKLGPHILPRQVFDSNAAATVIHFSQMHGGAQPDLAALLQTYVQPVNVPVDLQATFHKHEDLILQQALLLPYLYKELMVEAKKRFGSIRPIEIENEFLPELIRIEASGIPVDAASLIPHLAPLEKRMAELNKAMEESMGKHIDVRQRIREELQPIQAEISFIKKFTQTDNGRVFATFNSYSCASGRISTCSPNVQGIRRDYKGVLYLALPGRAIISVDLPASQLRIASIIANDEHLIEAIRANKDLHRETASRLFKKSPEEISEEERQIGKTANFQLLFGTGVESFKEKLEQQVGRKFNLRDVKGLIKAFREGYPGIAAWQDRMAADTNKSGKSGIQVTTLSGKKIHTCEYNQALNYAVAGSEAEIMKSAATYFATECHKRDIDARIINMVHDSIVVETVIEGKEEASMLLKKAVEQAMNLALKIFTTFVEVIVLTEKNKPVES